MKDNTKDVCEKEADATQRIAKAQLQQQYQPNAKHLREVEEAKAKGAYQVAEEKCDDSAGEAKKMCEDQAKAEYEQAKTALESRHP